MIHLFYLENERHIGKHSLLKKFSNILLQYLHFNTDLIITSNEDDIIDLLCYSDKKYKSYIQSFMNLNKLISPVNFNIEDIKSEKLNNIIALSFDNYNLLLDKIISVKSKYTEIIGISNFEESPNQKLLLEISNYLDNDYSLDQIKIILSLQYNLTSSIINKYILYIKNKRNSKIKKVKSLMDVKRYIKMNKNKKEEYNENNR